MKGCCMACGIIIPLVNGHVPPHLHLITRKRCVGTDLPARPIS